MLVRNKNGYTLIDILCIKWGQFLPLVAKGYSFFQNQRNGRHLTPNFEQLGYPHRNVRRSLGVKQPKETRVSPFQYHLRSKKTCIL